MKVFISWSGDASRRIASALYEWLPMVVQSIQPYMSSESIEKGSRWATSIAGELEGSSVGIVVLTPENTTAPWIHFEAGALAKVVGEAKLAPLLFGLKPSDVGTPLSQFQVTLFTKDDVLRLLKSINGSGDDEALPEGRLEKMHSALWNDLQQAVEPIVASIATKPAATTKKPQDETAKVLEELLVLIRQQSHILMNPDRLISRDAVRSLMEEMSTRSFAVADDLRPLTRALYRRWIEVRRGIDGLPASEQPSEAWLRLERAVDKHHSAVQELLRIVDPYRRSSAATDRSDILINTPVPLAAEDE